MKKFVNLLVGLGPLGVFLVALVDGVGVPIPGGVGAGEVVFGTLYKLLGYPFAAGVLGAMGRRLIEFTLGFIGYLVYLRMGPAVVVTSPVEPQARSASKDEVSVV